ncbi:MAG: DUF2171 domain-containing protein [Tepidiformaceae bacterium]
MHTNLATDTTIYTSDGEDIGKVKEVRGDLFKVNAAMQPDYWLPCATVATTDVEGVRVSFPKSALDANKREGPDN